MSLRDYVDYMETDSTGNYNNTLYIFQSDVGSTHPGLMADFGAYQDVITRISSWAGVSPDPGAGVQFYLGPANTGAQPHSHSHAWNMLVWGSKLWYHSGLLISM